MVLKQEFYNLKTLGNKNTLHVEYKHRRVGYEARTAEECRAKCWDGNVYNDRTGPKPIHKEISGKYNFKRVHA